MEHLPKISILMPLYNAERFIRPTLDSVITQTFRDWEIIAFDGNSTDKTREILETYSSKYPNIRLVSGPSESAYYAILEARKYAHGKYIMVLCASDGYVNPKWLETCAHVLDSDSEISLVWGIPVEMREDGSIVGTHFLYSQFFKGAPVSRGSIIRRIISKMNIFHPTTIVSFLKKLNPARISAFSESLRSKSPLEKQAWFSYWLKTGLIFPDGNMCMISRVFDECMPPYNTGSHDPGDWMEFYYQMNFRGFMSKCIPELANFARLHGGQVSEVFSGFNDEIRSRYYEKLSTLRKNLSQNPASHKFQNQAGDKISSYQGS